MPSIKTALVGIGNCASAFVQGIEYYRNRTSVEDCIGVRNILLGGFRPENVEIVAAFDVDSRKVGKDLSEAIAARPDNIPKLADVPTCNVIVHRGPVMDGLGEYTKRVVNVSDAPEVSIAKALKESDAEIVINLLPSGAAKASQYYAEQALVAGCGFVNTTPTFIASDAAWVKRFEEAGMPIAGDDLIDQVGATTLHKTLLQLLSTQGVRITETYQLDVGGGMESLDTLERTKEIKRIVKTESVESALSYPAAVVAGSTDYVDFLQNRRDSYFWIRGLYFGRTPMQLDLKLSTVDAPNAGSVLLDVVRAMRIARDRGLKGAILPICAYAFKRPPQHIPLEAADRMFTEFITDKKE